MLEGIRVVEVTTEPGGALAGRLLAAYGADVIVVEPPQGHAIRSLPPRASDDPNASILFAYLGSGKRSITIDFSDPADLATLRTLIDSADVVIESQEPGTPARVGLDPEVLIEASPRLVICSITPFGQDGPRAHWRATSITAAAAGGEMSVCGESDQPPLKTAGHQAHYQAGLHAFSAILSALYAVKRTGVGDWLDISIQEVQASTLEGVGPGALFTGLDAGRTAGNHPFAQWGIHECKDGYIGIASMPRQSFSVYDCIGHPELKDDPDFASGWSPVPNELLSVLIPEWTSTRTAEEIFEYAAGFRAPFSMIPTPKEILNWPGLADVSFWREVTHPVLGQHPLPSPPIAFADGSRGVAKRAPLLGEHNAEVRSELSSHSPKGAATTPPGDLGHALDGVRVVDVTAVWAGPYGTRFLADLGAEVIKVEGPSAADPIRTMAGARSVPGINQSNYFNEYNRNKLGISLDIKQPEGMDALKRLVANSDVFIENWSSGVADRIGLGYEALKAINPTLIYVSMPGFGHTGRDATRIGFGPTIEQMGGLVALQGYEGGPPHRSGISYGDPISGTIAAGAVAMLLLNRERTGEGGYAVVAQRDSICSLIGEFVLGEALGHPLPLRIGGHDAEWAPQNVYAAADTEPRQSGRPDLEFTDSWVAISVDSDAAWTALKKVVGDPRLNDPAFDTQSGRYAAQVRLDDMISEWTATRDAVQIATDLQAVGVAAAPVLTPLMVTNDAHLEARGFFMPYEHPDTGVGRGASPAWRWKRRPHAALRSAPRFGEQTDEILARVAGYSPDELRSFAARQITTSDIIPGAAG